MLGGKNKSGGAWRKEDDDEEEIQTRELKEAVEKVPIVQGEENLVKGIAEREKSWEKSVKVE
ncbi:hypothetical protein LINPERHAP2_LOCUS22725 [Linum perenne]